MLSVSFDIAGIRVRHNFSMSSLFTAICKISQSAKYESAHNHIRKDVDISRKPIIPFKHILHCDIFNPPMFFAGYRGFPSISSTLFFQCHMGFFGQFYVLFLCFFNVFMSHFCRCAGFLIGTCAVKPVT